MNPIAAFFSTLLASRTQAHIYHWQVQGPGSDAAHRALGAYYDSIIALIDPLVESIQGKQGILTGYTSPGQLREFVSFEEIIAYFTALSMYVEQNRNKLPQDTYVQNQVDNISELLNTTIYKLKFLK